MGISFQLTDASHKYGLDSMPVTPALFSYTTALFGSLLNTSNSWGTGPLVVGQSGTITTTLSGGFTQKITLSYSDIDRGVISSVQTYRTATNELLTSALTSINFTTTTIGTALQPENQYSGADTISGNSYNNVLKGYAGNDRIDGGAGIDTAVFTGFASQYQIQKSGTALLTSGVDGVDTLLNIERLQFDDKKIAFDISGNAGFAVEILGAVLGRDLMMSKKPLIGTVIDLFDQGFTLPQLSGALMRLDIWGLLANAGQPGASNVQIANYLLTTVNRVAPDAATLAAGVNALNTETGAAQGNFLWHLAESSANQVQVGLVGLANTGLEYF